MKNDLKKYAEIGELFIQHLSKLKDSGIMFNDFQKALIEDAFIEGYLVAEQNKKIKEDNYEYKME